MNISNWGTVLLFGVFTVFCYGVVIGVLPRMRGPGARVPGGVGVPGVPGHAGCVREFCSGP